MKQNNKEVIGKSLKDEIESQRAMLQTYLASDMDIDEMDYNEVVNYAISEVNEQNEFLGHWKDYAYMRGKLQGFKLNILSKEKEMFDKFEKIIEEEQKIIEVMEDTMMTLWKKKGDMCWSRDIVELSKLIKNGWSFK